MSAVIRLRKSSSQNKTNYVNQKITTDLRATISEVNHQNVPVGSVMATLTVTGDPNGWFICDGRALPRQYYPALFDAIGTRYGTSADTSIFFLPDLRGAFLRGTGTNAANPDYVGPANISSTPQLHATQSHSHKITDLEHKHEVTYAKTTDVSVKIDVATVEVESKIFSGGNNVGDDRKYDSQETQITYTGTTTDTTLEYTGITYTEEEPEVKVSPNVNKNDAGFDIKRHDKETRPFNYGVNWIIKA
jgi:microcystin-dependent protein